MKYILEFNEIKIVGDTWLCLTKTEDENDSFFWITEQLNQKYPQLNLQKYKILEKIKPICVDDNS